MTTWLPAGTKAAIGGGMPVDVVSAATPLAYLKTGDLEGLKQIAPWVICSWARWAVHG